VPSEVPSVMPSARPSETPSAVPSVVPTVVPSVSPSTHPTLRPTLTPTQVMTRIPTAQPTQGVPTPIFVSATFASDGSYLSLLFNGATNRAGFTNTFNCYSLFKFKGVNSSTCVWQDSSTVYLYQKSSESSLLLTKRDQIVLKSVSSFTAACPISFVCSQLRSVSAATVNVTVPKTLILPVVTISGQREISYCTDKASQALLLDLTSSTGNAGRAWSMEWKVKSSLNATNALQIQQYLTKNYTFSPPSPIPTKMLLPGSVYNFTVTLSNFLGAAATRSFQSKISSDDSSIPTVTIAGASSISMFRRYPLQIKSNAFTVNCAGTISYTGLQYAWQLSVVSGDASQTVISKITSSSPQNPSVFTLAGYSLPAGSVYKLTVTVTSTISSRTASSSVTITVDPGVLIPIITGGATQTVQLNRQASIDGSKSYDQDKLGVTGRAAELSYSWSCSNCRNLATLDQASLQSETLLITPTELEALTTVFKFMMVVSDKTRAANSSVLITVTTKQVNSVVITTGPQAVTSVSVAASLGLSTNLVLYSPCRANWTVDDKDLDLKSVSAIFPSQLFNIGKQQFNLKLFPNTLSERSTFVFTLVCGNGASSITVTTNGAPVPGQFLINPPSGVELTTVFTFSASFWSDPDLPITYQFGFRPPGKSSRLIISGRSPSTSASTALSAGSPLDDYYLNCTLQVYDVLNASTSLFNALQVTGLSATQQKQQLVTLLASGETASQGNTDAQKALISVASATLNNINCTVPHDCASLNRQPCSKTAYTCGSCLAGYQGDSGDRNSLCVSLTLFSLNTTTLDKKCHADAECPNSLQVCVQGNCQFPSKQCPGDCSENGHCQFRYTSTGQSSNDCKISDLSCDAICDCYSGYIGLDCSIRKADLPALQQARSVLVKTLLSLVVTDTVTTESVPSWASYLSSVSNNPDEFSETDSGKVQWIGYTVISAGTDLNVDPAELTGVLSAVNGVASTLNASSPTHNQRSTDMLKTLNRYSDLVSQNLLYGEEPAVVIYDNFRITNSVQKLSSDMTDLSFTVPKTEIENAVGSPKTSVSLQFNNETVTNSSSSANTLSLSLVQTFEKSYTKSPDSFYSDPIQLAISSNGYSTSDILDKGLLSSIIFTIQHNEGFKNFVFGEETAENFTTGCVFGIVNTSSFHCRYSPKVLTHRCDGTFTGTQRSACPMVVPSCNVLNVTAGKSYENSSCVTLNYTATETVCSCPLSSPYAARRFLQARSGESILQDDGVTNMVAATSYLANDFVHTFSAEGELNSKDGAKKAAIIIAVVCVIWGGGFILLFFVNYREYLVVLEEKQRQKEEEEKDKASMVSSDSHRHLIKPLKQQIMNYIDLILPAVYNVHEGFFQRTLKEVRLHHRYVHLFVIDTRRPNLLDRIYRTVKILSILTLQMFLQAMLFDLQNPEDDGSCPTFKSELTCLVRKTILDQSQSYCDWELASNSNNYCCVYSQPVFSNTAVIYVMVITAIVTSLFKTPLDLLLKIWICPVYEEEDLQRTMKVHPMLPETDNSGFVPVHHHVDESWKIPYMGFKHWWHYLIRLKDRRFGKRKLPDGSIRVKSGRSGKQPGEEEDEDDAIHNFGRAIPSAVVSTHHSAHKNLSVVENVYTVTNELKHKGSRRSMLAKKKEPVAVDGATDLEKGTAEEGNNITAEEQEEDKANPYLNNLCENILKHQLTLSRQVHRRKSVVGAAAPLEQPEQQTNGNNLTHRKKSVVQVQQEQDRIVQLYQDQWGVKEETVQLIPALLSSPQQLEAFDADAIANYSAFYLKSQKALSKLQPIILRSNSVTAGLELMNLFIIDLLGYNTKSARIFRNKFDVDYEVMFLVTRVVKYLCVLFVFGLNAFFMWYLLLRAVYKGHSWQWQFLKVIISQFLIEIILFESIECLSLHYLIPESVRHDVKKAVHILQLIADNIDTLIIAQQKQQQQQIASTEFDSTSYFFLSKALTKLRPELLETYIINAYQNPFPGMICHTWSHYKRRSKLRPHLITNEEEDHEGKNNQDPGHNHNPFMEFFHRSSGPESSNGRDRSHQYQISSDKDEPLPEEQNSLWKKYFAPNSCIFLVVSSLANGIIYCLQSLGVLPMASQRVVVRAFETSLLSGLTILYYTAQTQSALFAVFVVVVFAIILFFLIRNSYKQKAKADAMFNDENLLEELQEEEIAEDVAAAVADADDDDSDRANGQSNDDHDNHIKIDLQHGDTLKQENKFIPQQQGQHEEGENTVIAPRYSLKVAPRPL
jgi:hypothetical protein